MPLLKINGHTQFFTSIRTVEKVSPGYYLVSSTKGSFQVQGGKASGGSRREWFLDGFGSKAIAATSLMDALRLIDNA